MKILVLHLDSAHGDALAATLREDGHEVTAVSAAAAPLFAPDVLVICLDAGPQRTLDVAAKLAASAGAQAASMLFVGGTSAALGEAQRRFPTASFTRIDALSTALASMEG